MKKALALVLSLLVAFSMFAVAASAADTEDLVEVVFVYRDENYGEQIERISILPGNQIIPSLVPEISESFIYEYVDAETEEPVKKKITFKGWKYSVDDKIYYENTLPVPAAELAGKTVAYEAQYSIEDYSERQTFWNLIESIFERLNILFEYFATIFNF